MRTLVGRLPAIRWRDVLGLIAHFNTPPQAILVQELARMAPSARPRPGIQRRLRA